MINKFSSFFQSPVYIFIYSAAFYPIKKCLSGIHQVIGFLCKALIGLLEISEQTNCIMKIMKHTRELMNEVLEKIKADLG